MISCVVQAPDIPNSIILCDGSRVFGRTVEHEGGEQSLYVTDVIKSVAPCMVHLGEPRGVRLDRVVAELHSS